MCSGVLCAECSMYYCSSSMQYALCTVVHCQCAVLAQLVTERQVAAGNVSTGKRAADEEVLGPRDDTWQSART